MRREGRDDLAYLGTNTYRNSINWRKTLMQYKSFGNKKTVPSRMSRKRLRREVFVYNKTASKKLRSSLRRERRAQLES